jgi:hypothetical protein
MFSYHKKTHNAIPAETYCHFGCGCLATHCNTGGKYTCCKNYQDCKSYIEQLSIRTKESWTKDSSRKEKTKQSLIARLHNQETVSKMIETKRKKFGKLDPAVAKEYRQYARAIRQRAQKWARDNGYEIGRQTYHVDHKLSIQDAWNAKLSADIVNHPLNLQIIESKKNTSKGSKSIITVAELLQLINEYS